MARVGDYKFLKILDNTFLFNVVEDPLERGNLKERRKDIYDRIVAEWQAWNASMLPEIAESFTRSFTGEELADHYGSQKASEAPDPTVPLTPAAQSRAASHSAAPMLRGRGPGTLLRSRR